MYQYCFGGCSKYSLKVHLIFVTKYRKSLFCNKIMNDVLKQLFFEITSHYNYNIIQMETDKDHIHILLDYNPNTSVSKIVKQLKQYTTYHIWGKYEKQLSKIYWKKRVLWSDGYFACSIGQVSQDVIEKYILTQG